MRGNLPTLLCVGIPGAGKTVLASIAIEYLQSPERSEKLRVAYFFCNYQRQEEQKTQDILAALLRQLVEQQDQIPEGVHKLYQSYKSSRPSSDELFKILSIIGNHDRVYLIVDALDECSEEVRKRVCKKIRSLQDISNTSFMATSRPIDAMNKEFPPNSRFEIRAQAEDVEMYLETELKYLPECISDSPDMRRDVKKCIADGIDGMFLLSRLYLDSLKDKYTTREVKDTLRISTDLTVVYDSAIKRIESQPEPRRNWARRVLSWVLHSRRPLTFGEFRHALAIKLGDYQIDEENLPRLGEIISFCAGLVTLNNQSNVIQLVHYTTKQYFETVQERYDWTRNAPVEISKLCLTYLSFNTFAGGFAPDDESFEERLNQNSLLDYAAHYWGEHVYGVQKDFQIQKLAKSFLQNPALTSSISQAMFAQAEARFRSPGYSQHTPQMTGLHLAAVFGLDVLLSDLLIENQSNVDERDSHNQTPLYLAAMRGHEE
ncbi:hypothetical protein Egran_01149, partial [Elaphomyces granulatus]